MLVLPDPTGPARRHELAHIPEQQDIGTACMNCAHIGISASQHLQVALYTQDGSAEPNIAAS